MISRLFERTYDMSQEYFHGSPSGDIKSFRIDPTWGAVYLAESEEYALRYAGLLSMEGKKIRKAIGFIYRCRFSKAVDLFDVFDSDLDEIRDLAMALKVKTPKKFLKAIREEDWQRLYGDEFGIPSKDGWSRGDLRLKMYDVIQEMGYDGVKSKENIKMGEQTITIGVFNPKLIKIIEKTKVSWGPSGKLLRNDSI
jgi:hypothetical protein